MIALIACLILLNIADLWTTHQTIRFGGREGSPWMAKLFAYFGALPTLWGKVVFAGVAAYIIRDSMIGLVLLNILYTLVAFWNYGELMSQQGRTWWGSSTHALLEGIFNRGR
jgi:hypothetical protein